MLDISTPKRPRLHLDVCGLSCTWTWLHYRGFNQRLSSPHGPELNLDFSRLVWNSVLLLNMSTPKEPELHPDVSGQQELCCSWTGLH